MFLIYGRVEIHIPAAASRKDKRQVVQSLTARLKNRFSMSVMELDHQETWQRSTIGFAAVCRGPAQAEQIRMAVLDTVDDAAHSCELLDFHYEIENV